MQRSERKKRSAIFAILIVLSGFFPPAAPVAHAAESDKAAIMVAAAASLRLSFENGLLPAFRNEYPWITVEGTYDSSGKLQAQIENGLNADVFVSAATRQMDSLTEKGHINAESVVPLLENRIVLIRPAVTPPGAVPVTGFADLPDAAAIAVGDPDSVPAGDYAREMFTTIGMWEEIRAKASFGTNVTEVLAWVAEGSADAGVVYATDAASTKGVTIVAEAPADSLKRKVVYPVGIAASSNYPEAAGLFLDFLRSEKGLALFRRYGFTPYEE